MVAILAGIKILIIFLFKYVFKIIAIGFVLVLFVIALWHSVEQMHPEPFVKEFGGRILMVDRTIEERLNNLVVAENANFSRNVVSYLSIILDILMLYYIIKFVMWVFRFWFGETPSKFSFIIGALLVMAIAEVLYMWVFLGYVGWPFIGFISIVTNFVPLIVIPFAEWFKLTFHISSVPSVGNETMSWWDRLFM